ncbi:hypothetical protein [Hugonella massiliensis]|uniref:hypothetical protein n=1 Tax=Hugonella massiliensis TaxID=1720315 RepID=UPI00073F948E|nr:hypothetical protein [Hugonella massiliensis]
MPSYSKKSNAEILRIASIIMIVWGVIDFIAGIFLTATGGALVDDVEMDVAGAAVAIFGMAMICAGIVNAIVGLIGMKSAKQDGPHTVAFVLGIITTLGGLFTLFSSFGSGDAGQVVNGIIGLVVPALYLYGAYQLRKEAA